MDHYELEKLNFNAIGSELGWLENVQVGDLANCIMALCAKCADMESEIEKLNQNFAPGTRR